MYSLIYIFFKKNSGAFPEAYDAVSDVLASCQLAAFLEVIHPVIGIVRTGALAPFMQVDLFSLITVSLKTVMNSALVTHVVMK